MSEMPDQFIGDTCLSCQGVALCNRLRRRDERITDETRGLAGKHEEHEISTQGSAIIAAEAFASGAIRVDEFEEDERRAQEVLGGTLESEWFTVESRKRAAAAARAGQAAMELQAACTGRNRLGARVMQFFGAKVCGSTSPLAPEIMRGVRDGVDRNYELPEA